MPLTTLQRPVVLLVAPPDAVLAGMLQDKAYAVVHVPTGVAALEWAKGVAPDTIIIDVALSDMSGIEASRLLRGDPQVASHVPILVITPNQPTPEERLSALRAGAWDCLRAPRNGDELWLKLQIYAQAYQHTGSGPLRMADPATGLHTRSALARRARELGSLLSRRHGALACIVFALEAEVADPVYGGLLARTARMSDVVGSFSPTELALLAPETDPGGAVRFARRVADAISHTAGDRRLVPGKTLRAGYDAVSNLTYAPVDPVALLARAARAVRHGVPDPDAPWLRRFDERTTAGVESHVV